MAVIGIIGILSLAAVPVMRGLSGSQSSRAAAQILVSALEQARTGAILSGTNVYIVFPGNFVGSQGIPTNYYHRSYALIRPAVDLDGDQRDDFQTNFPAQSMAGTNTVTTWILLSKWEQLPGDLVFSPLRLSSYSNVVITALPVPKDPAWSGQLPSIAFSPAGGLADVTNSLALYFASAARTNNNLAELADWIEISRFSGRVRYAGITNNVNF